MSRTSLLVAVSGLALAACQPASEAPQELSAETPPVVEDVVEEVAAAPEESVEAAAETDTEIDEAHDHEDEHDHADEDHEHGDDHDDEKHDHADEHDHEDHAHEDAHDEGDHDHEDHDHEDHDHAGGEAHVHGLSDLAASLDGAVLSVNVEGALANFDLDESLKTLDDTTAYTDGTVAIVGGECSQTSAAANIRPIGDHGNLVIDWTYECAEAGAIEAIEVIGFQSFAGFAEVNAVFLTGTDQTAETLTASDTRLDLN